MKSSSVENINVNTLLKRIKLIKIYYVSKVFFFKCISFFRKSYVIYIIGENT